MSKKLYLIEDDIVLSQTLARRLAKQGFSVECHNDMATLLQSVPNYRADYFLIDLRLEEHSGLQLISEIRTNNPSAKIIVMTGFASIATAVEAIKNGADDYLPKPLDFSVLMNVLLGEVNTESTEENVMSADRIEWEHIQKILQQHQGNVSATARALGMHRRTLQRKLAKRPVGQ